MSEMGVQDQERGVMMMRERDELDSYGTVFSLTLVWNLCVCVTLFIQHKRACDRKPYENDVSHKEYFTVHTFIKLFNFPVLNHLLLLLFFPLFL